MTNDNEHIIPQEEAATDKEESTNVQETAPANPPKKHKWAKRLSWTIAALLLLIVLLPCALYIPWVQNIAKDWACDYVNKTTGLTVSIDRILIKFPLDVSVDGLLVLDERQDTMVMARNFTAGVKVKPLLDLRVEVGSANLKDGYYHLTSNDSSMLLTARIDECRLNGTRLDLDHNTLDLLNGELNGGHVDLVYQPWKVVEEPDTTTSDPWRITAKRIVLNDIDYSMAMLPTIDKMDVHVQSATLEDGIVDTGLHLVDARYLAIDSVDCNYYYLDEARAQEFERTHPLPPDTISLPGDTATWTIKGDSLRLNNGHATYAVAGRQAPEHRGMDMDYIEVSNVDLAIDDFYNRGTTLKVPIMSFNASERGGLTITQGSGTLKLDDEAIDVEQLRLATAGSDIYLDAHVPMATLDNPAAGEVRVTTNSHIDLGDITAVMPSLAPMLRGVPQFRPLSVSGEVKGNTSSVRLNNVKAELPHYASASVTGMIDNPTDFDRMRGRLNVDAHIDNIDFAKPTLLGQATGKQVNLPPMTLNADVAFDRGTVSGEGDLRLQGGSLVGKGSFTASNEGYEIDATANHFPVQAILPMMGVRDLTAHVTARGKGFDFLNSTTGIDAKVELQEVTYNGVTYKNIDTRLNLNNGAVNAFVASRQPGRDFTLDVEGSIANDHYILDVEGRINDLDVQALGYYNGTCRGSGNVKMYCDLDLRNKDYDGSITVNDLAWKLDDETIYSDEAKVTFDADKNQVALFYSDEGTEMRFQSDVSVDDFVQQMQNTAAIAAKQYKDHSLDINELQGALPAFNFGLKMGADGIVQRYLEKYEVDFRDVNCEISNDSTLYMDGWVRSLSVGQTAIDTISFHASEWNKYLAFDAHMGNRPGTWDEFAQVDIKGGARGSTVDFLVEQRNIKNEMGYRLGVNATLRDSLIDTRFFPENPIIGYRKWTINKDNYVTVDIDERRLNANLKLESGKSSVTLMAQPNEATAKNDILLKIDNLLIDEWTQYIPSLKGMKGSLDADMKMAYDGKNIEGGGLVKLSDFAYNDRKVGNLALNTALSIDPATSTTSINTSLDMDGSTVAVAMGSLGNNSDENPFNVNVNLTRFPLRKASAFIPGRIIALRGHLDGDLSVTGSLDKPVVNGYLQGDSAQIRLPRYGSTLRISEDRLSVVDNKINFNNFAIYGINDQPVTLNGKVDFSNLDDMSYSLNLRGRNVQFIGEEQKQFSEIFGKAFADIDGTLTGRGDLVDMRANVTVLPTSNITYVMQDEVSAGTTSSVDENMVTFVDPTIEVNMLDSLMTATRSSAVNVLVNINVEQGTKINAYLSTDGKDRASIEGNARLKYSLDFAGKDNLNGTYYITGGNVRYSPPVISQKSFDLNDGGTITWTGDMFNPQLDITGTQRVKASVNDADAGNSHLAEFEITAKVGGTLEHIDLSFDLDAPGDMEAGNELQSMTADQRSQAAINMLLYNTYSGLNTTGSINLNAGNALYSFLQSQLNSWAASSLKGVVDLSFGINQYDATTSGHVGTQTSYSYRLSKSLFNDRFKIVVGGEYSTDASSQENFSQNLINDVSVEYLLNTSGSRYVRIFHQKSYESILEGAITKTGVGFVMKHKLSSLGDLFHRSHKPQELHLPDDDNGLPNDDNSFDDEYVIPKNEDDSTFINSTATQASPTLNQQ